MERSTRHCQANIAFAEQTISVKLLYVVCVVGIISGFFVAKVTGHGRLIEPPSRASMWRYGFDTPHDYNDHESYCGGFTRQWVTNDGKCGICGDAWDVKPPRPHEAGGKYGTGVIVRRYRTGSVIPVRVELTANHHGYFEFRVCPMDYRNLEVTQDCLDQRVLVAENGTARYYPGEGNRIFEAYYKLPNDLTCGQCVFQWRYVAGNNWGDCGNGVGAVGCGPQEEFRACADIAIGDEEAPLPPRLRPTKRPTRPTSHPGTSTDSTDYKPEPSGSYWLYHFVVAGTCLLVVLAVMALLYAYYYHAGRAKQWLMASRLLTRQADSRQQYPEPPIAPPRHKKVIHNVGHLQI